MKHPTILYTLSLEFINYLLVHGSRQENHNEHLGPDGYSRTGTGESFKVFQDTTMVVHGLHNGLSIAASKIIHRISDELHMNNALWYYKPENTKRYEAIAELIEHGILTKSEDPYIFFVNPFYIRRGSPQSVLALTVRELYGKTRPTTDNIRELRYTSKVEFNPLDKMNADPLSRKMTRLIKNRG